MNAKYFLSDYHIFERLPKGGYQLRAFKLDSGGWAKAVTNYSGYNDNYVLKKLKAKPITKAEAFAIAL